MALRINATGKRLTRTTNLDADLVGITLMMWVQYVSNNSQDRQVALFYGDDTSQYEQVFLSNYGANFLARREVASGYGGDTEYIASFPTTGTWYWLAFAIGGSFTPSSYPIDTCFTPAGSSPSWISHDGTEAGVFTGTIAPEVLDIGATATPIYAGWSDIRCLAFKAWSTKLTTAQMEAERYWYEPQVTSNVHAWSPLIDESSDHSANGYNWTEVGTVAWEDYTPAGMNALQGEGGEPGQLWSTITL